MAGVSVPYKETKFGVKVLCISHEILEKLPDVCSGVGAAVYGKGECDSCVVQLECRILCVYCFCVGVVGSVHVLLRWWVCRGGTGVCRGLLC